MDEQVWYYEAGGKQEPSTLGEIRQMYREGRVTDTTLVWREGMSNWSPARACPELGGAPLAGQGAVGGIPTATAAALPVGTLAYSMPQVGPVVISDRAIDLFRQTRPWVRLFGILLWIVAGLMLLGGVAIMLAMALGSRQGGAEMLVIGPMYFLLSLLYIMPALYLTRYAKRLGEFDRLRRTDVLEQAIEAQKSFWKFVGVAVAIMFGVYALAMLGAVVFGMMR